MHPQQPSNWIEVPQHLGVDRKCREKHIRSVIADEYSACQKLSFEWTIQNEVRYETIKRGVSESIQ